MFVERSASAPKPGTVTDAGGTAGPLPDRRRALALEQVAPDDPDRDGADADRAGPDHERAARPVRHLRDRPHRPRRLSTADRGSGRSRSQPRTHSPTPIEMAVATAAIAGVASGSPSAARNPTTPKATNAIGRDLVPTPRDDAEHGAEEERDDDDEQLEGELVVRPEQADDEVLGARRLEVDDDLADRGDERGRTGQQACQQLRDAERGRGRDDPGDRRPPSRVRRRSTLGGPGAREDRAVVLTVPIIAARCDVRVSPSGPMPARRATRPRSAARTRGSGRRRAGRRRAARRRPRRRRPSPGRARTRAGSPRRGARRGRWPTAAAPPASAARSAMSVSRAPRSRLAAGSSRSSRSGSGISARAIEVRRRSPADSVPYGVVRDALEPEPRQQRRAPAPGRRRCRRATTVRWRRGARSSRS